MNSCEVTRKMAEAFLKRRLGDPRFRPKATSFQSHTAVTPWYLNSTSISAELGLPVARSNANKKFSKEKIEELRNKETSDSSDYGRCFSGWTEEEGKAPGEDGSCVRDGQKGKAKEREKREKKKKRKTDDD